MCIQPRAREGCGTYAWWAVAGRVLLVGAERVLLRRMGDGRDPAASAAAFFAIGAITLLPFAAPWGIANWSFLRLAVPSGLVYACTYWLYVGALTAGQVSAVAPLGSLSGVFVVALAFFFYGESIGPVKLLGAGCITAGAMALHQRRGASGGPGGAGNGAGWRMTAYALLTAVTRMADKAAATGPAGSGIAYAWTVFTIVALGQSLLLVLTGRGRALLNLVACQPTLALAAGACNGGSFLLLILAVTRLPISLAEPLTALSLLVSAGLAALWLHEPVRARWLPTLAVVAGTWLLLLDSVARVPPFGH